MRFDLNDYALFWPGVALALAVAAAVSARLGRIIDRPWPLAFGLTFCVGVIVAATLTPSRDALLYGIPGSGRCDLSMVVLPSIRDLRTLNDASTNVLLFLPLGITIAAIGWSRRTLILLVGALALPFAIELIQLVVTPLGRACQAVDVVDNLTGFVLGLAFAGLLWAVARLVGRDDVSPEGQDPRG